MPFFTEEYEHEIQHQVLEEMLDSVEEIDNIINSDKDINKIKEQNSKLKQHIEQLLGSSII